MPRLEDFEGEWRLERRIDDHRGGPDGRLQGRVSFGAVAGGLDCHEAGSLALGGGPPMAAERHYLWRPDGAKIAIFFDDGRFFHRFDPAVPAPEARHDCAPDLYRVRYDFRRWPFWRAEWRVTGPRKDYLMISEHTPA